MNLKNMIKKIPPIGSLYSCYYWNKHYRKLCRHAPGHFYSPIPDFDWVKENIETLFPENPTLGPEVDINEQGQKDILCKFSEYVGDFEFPEEKSDEFRYYSKNEMFGYSSGLILFCMIRHFKPKRIFEIGSGHTSALMIDTNERFMDHQMKLTFIEPYTDRLNSLIKDKDKKTCSIFEKKAQEVPASYFEQLEENDILFVDSSHVTKFGSDVNHIFFNILPILKPGVVIHFHDICWPFEYPKDWVLHRRAWNEAYLLRAFLQYNNKFEIINFGQYLCRYHSQFYLEQTGIDHAGGSIWLRKKA